MKSEFKAIFLIVLFYIAIYATCYLFQMSTFNNNWYQVASKLVLFISSWLWLLLHYAKYFKGN